MKLLLRICTFILLCLIAFPINAQQPQANELLYRSSDNLYLTNVTTGTNTALLDIKTSSSDQWLWSPNGHYLLGNLFIKNQGHVLRVYDADNQKWLINFRQQTGISAAWSTDSTQIAYTTSIKYDSLQRDGQLWVVDLKTAIPRLLYQTKITGDRALTDTGIEGIWWSPDNQFLLFEDYVFMQGHADIGLNLISADGKTFNQMSEPWRGNFNPIWSPDSKWFLLNLPNTNHFPVDPNDRGDVIAYSINDQIYDLTDTSKVQEQNLSWSSDSKNIQFEVGNQLVSIELQDVIDHPKTFAQHMSRLPPKRKQFGERDYLSPDGKYVAYLIRKPDNVFDLYTARPAGSQVTQVAASITFIGWRP